MIRPAMQNLLIFLYAAGRRSGLLSTPFGQRLYQWAYDVYKRRLEAGTVMHLRRWVPEGACVVDVGANVGFFTRRFADWVGSDGRVIAVEPERRNVGSLVEALRKDGHLARVDVVEAAASSDDGTLRLEINPDHPGDHRIGDAGEIVAAVALDTLIARYPGIRVSLIKIDVQGFEPRVLRGAAELIREHAPAIFIEIDPAALREQGSSTSALLRCMTDLHYDLYMLSRNGACEPVDEPVVTAKAEAGNGYVDLLCLPSGGHGKGDRTAVAGDTTSESRGRTRP